MIRQPFGTSTERQTHLWGVWLLGIIAVAAFGPYVAGPIRTDQLIAYGGLVLLYPFLLGRNRPTIWQVAALSTWSIFVILAIIVWATETVDRGSGALAMADNILLPLAVSVLTILAVGPEHRDRALRVIAWVASIGMTINAFVAFAQIASGETAVDLGRWSVVTGESTADRAAQLGRFSGLIGQPALAGMMYAVAMLCAIYVIRKRPVTLTVLLLLMVAGGVVTVSKMFLFAGLPILAIVYFFAVGRRHPYLMLVTVAGVGMLFWSRQDLLDRVSVAFPQWDGLARLEQLFVSELTVSNLTGNRFGEQGVVADHVAAVLDRSPFAGFGLGGGGFPIDSTLIFGLALAGVVGVAILVVFHAVLWGWLVSAWSGLRFEDRIFSLGLLALITAGAVGYPVLIGDRLSVILWPLLMLLMTPRTESSATH